MDQSGLDVSKIKALVIQKWRSSPELWPVKVLSLARLAELEKRQGGRKLTVVGGYITCLRAIRMKTPSQMEDLLGFIPGFLASGVSVWKLNSLPTADQFELRGYTQLPGGEPFDGIVLRPVGAPRPQFFQNDGSPAVYPPGLGVEQWELRRDVLIPAMELQRVSPGMMFTRWH